MFTNFAKKAFALVLPVAMLALAGCEEEGVNPSSSVDLSQTADLFDSPIKPNPLLTDPNSPIVEVNGKVITRAQVQKLLNANLSRFLDSGIQPEQLQQLQGQLANQIIDDLITQYILIDAVAKEGIVADSGKVQEMLTEIRESIPEGKTLEGLLEEQGESIETLMKDISNDVAINQLLEKQAASVAEATEAEAKEFYDGNPDQFDMPENATASHILIKFEEDPADEAASKAGMKAQLEKIRNDIIAGTISFADAAKQYSEDPGSKENGGEYKEISKGDMVPEFDAAVFSQEIGKVGPIVATEFGYHIIMVSERSEGGKLEFDEVKDQLVIFLTKQAKQKVVDAFVATLRESADIKQPM